MPRRRVSFLSFFQKPVQWFGTDQTDWVMSRSVASLPYYIALAAGVGLFLELAVIRWHSSLFSLFGFYKNFSLLSAFLGLGLGYAVGKRRPIRLGYVVMFLCMQLGLFMLIKGMRWHHSLLNPVNELLTMGLDGTQGWEQWLGVVGFLSIVYVFNAMTFLPIGQVAAALMSRVPNLKGYGFNLIGSLAGILAFTGLSYLWMPPEVWFAFGLAGLLMMMGASGMTSPAVVAFSLLFATFCVFEPRPMRRNVYSPYQALSIRPVNDANRVVVSVNQLYYQKILDLSKGQRDASAQYNAMSYDMPFQLSSHPDNVLIVGAGTGNDVAAALRRGAKHVDAVEIDPIIQRIGAELHPEKPYSDPRVVASIDDARAFLRKTDKAYDLIVYGLLDSHTMLSNLSNVRLDSFVYTVEAFREARTKLTDNGMLAISFSMISDGLGHKLFRMLKEAFDGAEPIVVQPGYDGGVLFLAGAGTKEITSSNLPMPNLASRYANYAGQVDISTDDWPFFYMPLRQYPVSYAGILLTLLALSLGMIWAFVPNERRSGVRESSGVFFFLGAGFMLIETRAITELGLSFGNTWLVVAVVISGLLTMAWAANWAAMKMPKLPMTAAFMGLAVCLLGGWWLQGQPQIQMTGAMKTLIAVSPLFFSGLLFSSALKNYSSVSMAMAANLFGSICGGLLEYHSMVAGFRSLYLLGFGMYACAYAWYLWQSRAKTKAVGHSGKVPLRKVANAR